MYTFKVVLWYKCQIKGVFESVDEAIEHMKKNFPKEMWRDFLWIEYLDF